MTIPADKKAQQKERSILRIIDTCVHFTGIQHPECKAGVNYQAQFGNGAGCFADIPCTRFGKESVKDCLKAQYPSREEAEKEEADREAHSTRALAAIRAAHADAASKGYKKEHGGQDSLKCPLCPDGTLRYSVASYNGHMHAGCTTPNCISWME